MCGLQQFIYVCIQPNFKNNKSLHSEHMQVSLHATKNFSEHKSFMMVSKTVILYGVKESIPDIMSLWIYTVWNYTSGYHDESLMLWKF